MTSENENIPGDRAYTREHHWLQNEPDGLVRIGITDFGQRELGEIVFVSPPSRGSHLKEGDRLIEIESTKVMWELSTPVSGEVIEVNRELDMRPELLNEDPYGTGWIVRLRVVDTLQPEALMDAAAYEIFLRKDTQ